MSRTVAVARVKGLDKTSPGYLREHVRTAERRGLDPSYLAAVISFETGGTFSPSIKNPVSGATGLIQFMPSTAHQLGTTTTKLSQLSAEKQLAYVDEYYRQIVAWKGKLQSLEDHYLAVLGPANVGKPPSAVLYSSPSKAYTQNAALDKSGDGTITNEEATTPVRGIYNAAKKLPPILVTLDDDGSPSPGSGSSSGPEGAIGAALLIAITAFSIARWKTRGKLS